MAEIKGKLSELIPDDKNLNKHTQFGMSLLEKSVRGHKFGRSILVDKNNRIIAGNGIEFPRPKRSEEHPTMKPVPLFAYLMENSTEKGDLVLDSFGGSGTTIIAAEQLGRKARVMELDPHYCDVIIARWEKLTGQKARKVFEK